jgi:hypothetical protein
MSVPIDAEMEAAYAAAVAEIARQSEEDGSHLYYSRGRIDGIVDMRAVICLALEAAAAARIVPLSSRDQAMAEAIEAAHTGKTVPADFSGDPHA